jgi:hypothetical protein
MINALDLHAEEVMDANGGHQDIDEGALNRG